MVKRRNRKDREVKVMTEDQMIGFINEIIWFYEYLDGYGSKDYHDSNLLKLIYKEWASHIKSIIDKYDANNVKWEE